MATTTNYGWTTPNDTDLVKDGAAAIRTLGSSVDTTTKALNPSTTLGDIEYRSATANTNTRLPIGTTGQILNVNGSGVPAWTTPPAAGWSPNFTLLNAGGTALTGASTITVSVSSYDSYVIYTSFPNSSANALSALRFRFNGDSGANYIYVGTGYAGTDPDFVFQQDDNSFKVANMGTSASDGFYGIISLIGGKNTGGKSVTFAGGAQGTSSQGYAGTGLYLGSAAITSISVISSTGSFDQTGKVFIYGG
jgi:hypothetical protein